MTKVEKNINGTLKVTTTKEVIDGVSKLIWAIGRHPLTKTLNLDKAGVKTNPDGTIIVDEYQNTSNPNIQALGDVCGKALLTPGNVDRFKLKMLMYIHICDVYARAFFNFL